jgi:hypothetical protein
MVSMGQGPSQRGSPMQAVATSHQDRQFSRDAHGKSVRFVPLTGRNFQLKISSPSNHFTPAALQGRSASLIIEWNGERRALPCVLGTELSRDGLDSKIDVFLLEPSRFDEIAFDGRHSRIREIRFDIKERHYIGMNLYFCGSRYS